VKVNTGNSEKMLIKKETDGEHTDTQISWRYHKPFLNKGSKLIK
jgi:hypothetical protein